MNKLRRASILGATVLSVALFCLPEMGFALSVKINKELCRPAASKDCVLIMTEVAKDRLRVRKTRITCKDASGYTKVVTDDKNIDKNEAVWFYLNPATCLEYMHHVKGSFVNVQGYNECKNWKSKTGDFIPIVAGQGSTKYYLDKPSGANCRSMYVRK